MKVISHKICNGFLACFTCGVKLLEYRYGQVWIIAEAEPSHLIPRKPIENLKILTPLMLIDAYMHHTFKCTGCWLTHIYANAITFLILVYLGWIFPQMFFTPRHINPDNFIQIEQKRFGLQSLVANHLARLRFNDFFKKLLVLTLLL